MKIHDAESGGGLRLHVLRVCPTAEASSYDGAGHAPQLEAPERFNRDLALLTRRVNG